MKSWIANNFTYKLPNRKRKLITKEFLQDLKNEIDNLDAENRKKCKSPHTIDYSKKSYFGFYGEISSTYLFYDALKNTCIKHNLTKAVYEYSKNLPWYYSDVFNDYLFILMVDEGIIPFETKENKELCEYKIEHDIKYKLIHHYKGYDVVEYDWWFKDDKQGLERIYKDCDNIEIVWLEE